MITQYVELVIQVKTQQDAVAPHSLDEKREQSSSERIQTKGKTPKHASTLT